MAPVWRVLGDEQLARAAGDGNDSAFAALYARYRPALRSYCASILLDQADAEDAVQATMLKAMRALGEHNGRGPLRPWLYRIAHNEAIDMLRRRRTQAGPAALDTCSVAGPDADLARRERLAELVADLRSLPPRQGAALLMRELSGLSYDEVAGALDITTTAARQAVFEARTALHDFAAGRDTACAAIQRSLSDADRRRWRSRAVRAHLRSCEECRSFQHAITRRGDDLALLPPFVLEGTATVALGGLLSGMTGGGASGIGVLAGLAGGTAAKTLAGAAATLLVGGAALGGGLRASDSEHQAAPLRVAPPATALAAPTPIAAKPARPAAAAPVRTRRHAARAIYRVTSQPGATRVVTPVKRRALAVRQVAPAVTPAPSDAARPVLPSATRPPREVASQPMRDAVRQAVQQAVQSWSAGTTQSKSSWEQVAQQYASQWAAAQPSTVTPTGATTAQPLPTGQWSGQSSTWQATWQEYAQRMAGDAATWPTAP